MFRETGGVACHPAGLSIWRWFLELNRTRGKHTIVVSSMTGSQVISEPAGITWMEIDAWSRVTRRQLTRWEAEQISLMDTVFIAVVNGGKGQKRQGQGLGEYCQGRDLEECRKQLGNEEALKQACSTCPN